MSSESLVKESHLHAPLSSLLTEEGQCEGAQSPSSQESSQVAEDVAIRVQHLSKCYHIYDKPHDRLKQSIYPRLQRLVGKQPKQYFREFWALKDVSFEIKRGETVGIIGRNGSGKSTLLQLICGTLNATSGTIETQGRITALLELGSGFNPEFTGRENVYLNAAVLGLSKEETDARFDEIVAFADISDFIEQPVKTYSSGMFVRLAFASNIMANPEIMIVDEALAVGDMNFQAKCMTALTRIQERGATVLFVSHDIGTVKSLCSRGIYLDQGTMKAIGKAPEVADQYLRVMREEMNAEQRQFVRVSSEFMPAKTSSNEGEEQSGEESELVFKRSDEFTKRVAVHRHGSGDVRIAFVEMLGMNDEPVQSVEFNQLVKLRVYFEALADKMVSVNFHVQDDKKNNLIGCGFRHVDQAYLEAKGGDKYLAEYRMRLPLQEGNYSLRVQIVAPVIVDESAEFVDVVEDASVFRVNRWEKARVWSKVHLFPELALQRIKECHA